MATPRWSRFPSDVADELSKSTAIELPVRLFFLAVSRNRGDGHAQFKKGDIARGLEIDPKNVGHLVKRAVQWNLIQAHSSARCVVLPKGVTHGHRDDAHPWCRWHPVKPEKREHRRGATAFGDEHRRGATESVSKHRRGATAFGDVSAGHDDPPLLLSSSPLETHQEGANDDA